VVLGIEFRNLTQNLVVDDHHEGGNTYSPITPQDVHVLSLEGTCTVHALSYDRMLACQKALDKPDKHLQHAGNWSCMIHKVFQSQRASMLWIAVSAGHPDICVWLLRPKTGPGRDRTIASLCLGQAWTRLLAQHGD
jgi:hypothetical protein